MLLTTPWFLRATFPGRPASHQVPASLNPALFWSGWSPPHLPPLLLLGKMLCLHACQAPDLKPFPSQLLRKPCSKATVKLFPPTAALECSRPTAHHWACITMLSHISLNGDRPNENRISAP